MRMWDKTRDKLLPRILRSRQKEIPECNIIFMVLPKRIGTSTLYSVLPTEYTNFDRMTSDFGYSMSKTVEV